MPVSADSPATLIASETTSLRHSRTACIAFLFTHGFAARMILRSGIARELVAQGVQVIAISPNADEAYFQRECQQEGVMLKLAPQIDGLEGRIADWCRTYRPYFLDDVMHNVALKTKENVRFEKQPFLGFTMKMINRNLAKWSTFRKVYQFIESNFNRSKEVRELLSEIKPDFLVVPNTFGREETIYLIHAKELDISVICQMLSWDNITSKGTPLFMPDYFISWGKIMTEEMIDLYHFPQDKIYECGVPHFDIYFQQENFTSRDIIMQELQLPPEHPYILYGMVAPYSCPNELEILTWLVEQINRHAFLMPCSLVIRPHPQTIRGVYAKDNQELERLQGLVGPRVALDLPPVLSDRLAWDLPKNDMYRLASLLAGSAMCLNASSTLCLDACVLDCPVINVGFDGREALPYDLSARRGLDFTHMAKLLALGGVRVARTFDELAEHINAYLHDPALDREGRKRSAAQECGSQDGQAAMRVISTLLELEQCRAH